MAHSSARLKKKQRKNKEGYENNHKRESENKYRRCERSINEIDRCESINENDISEDFQDNIGGVEDLANNSDDKEKRGLLRYLPTGKGADKPEIESKIDIQNDKVDDSTINNEGEQTLSNPMVLGKLSNFEMEIKSQLVNELDKQVKNLEILDSDIKKSEANIIGSLKGQEEALTKSINYASTRFENIIEATQRKLRNSIEYESAGLSKGILNSKEDLAKEASSIKEDLKREISDSREDLRKSFIGSTQRINSNIDSAKSSLKKDIINIPDKIQPSIQPLKTDLKNLKGEVKQFSDEMQEKLTDIKNLTETTMGKLTTLDKIDDIADILKAKGTVLKREFPASNHDEETIMALSAYGIKAIEELTIAARLYARNATAINDIREERIKHEAQITKIQSEFYDKGYIEGEKKALETLIDKLTASFDMSHFMTHEFGDGYGDKCASVIVSFFKDHGMEMAEGYNKGDEIVIDSDNISKAEGFAKFPPGQEGTYIVKTPCLLFNGKICCKAELELKNADESIPGDENELIHRH